MEKSNSRNKIRYFEKFGFQMYKAVCILVLLSTFTFANAQCDLKLTEKITKLLQDDGFIYLKDFVFEFEEVNSSNAYSFLLKKDKHYFLYFGAYENDDSEIEFAVTKGNTDIKLLTVISSGKITKVKITPKENAVYNIKAQSTKGEKSCGVIVLGTDPPANNPEIKTTGDNKIYLMADEMPEFISGEKDAYRSFKNWIKNNFSYPEVARKKGITGIVYISFVVNQTGNVTNINVIRGLDPEVDAYYIKELKKCPRWQKPGKDRGKPVNVQFTFQIEVKPK